jgi:hypothetical protein
MLLSVWLSTFLAKSFLEPQPSEERQFLTATKHQAGVLTQAAGRPGVNRGAGLRRERLPQGSSEGGAVWENLRIR